MWSLLMEIEYYQQRIVFKSDFSAPNKTSELEN